MPEIERRPCPYCGESIARQARVCRFCGADPDVAPQPAPTPPPPHGAPGGYPEPPPPLDETDATGGVIPYKNAPALIAYYLGVFSVIPLFPIGLAGLVLGIKGLKLANERPAVRGKIHAWIGILIGGAFGLLWLGLTIWFIGWELD